MKNSKCKYCDKLGHVDKACVLRKRLTKQDKIQKICNQELTEDNSTEEMEDGKNSYKSLLNAVQNNKIEEKIMFTVQINQIPLEIEVNSRAAYNVIGQATFEEMFGGKLSKLKTLQQFLRFIKIPLFQRAVNAMCN